MMKNRFNKAISVVCVFILSILSINFALAQPKNNDEISIFKEGKKMIKNECYNLALPYFLYLQKEHPKNSNFNYCVGMCYYNISSMYDSCIYYLNRATNDVTRYYQNQYGSFKAPIEVYYYLGIAYLKNNMTETAIRHFKQYERFLDPEVKKHRLIKADVDKQILICEQEKSYAEQQRQRRAYVSDSIKNDMEFYKVNYLGTVQLLDEKIIELNQLEKENAAIRSTQNRSIGSSNIVPVIENSLIVHIIASENAVNNSNLDKIQDLKQCRTADGVFHYFVGGFSSREEAERRCKEIRNYGFPNAWISLALTCK